MFGRRPQPNSSSPWLRRAARSAVVAVATLGALVVFLNIGPGAALVGRYVSDRISNETSLSVACGPIHLFPWAIDLDDVSVARSGGPTLRAERIRVAPDMLALLAGRFRVRRLAIDGFFLTFSQPPPHREASGDRARPETAQTLDVWRRRLRALVERLNPDGPIRIALSNGTLAPAVGPEELGAMAIRSLVVVHDPTRTPAWNARTVVPGPDGTGNQVAMAIDADLERIRMVFKAPGIALEPFRPLVQQAGARVLEHVPHLPRLGGSFTVEVDLRDHSAQVEGTVRLSHLAIQHPLLAKVPIRPIDLVQRVNVEVSWRPFRLRVGRWEGWINGAAYQLAGTIQQDGEALPCSVRLVLDDLPYQDILDAIPPEVIPVLVGVELGGTLDLTIDVHGNLRSPRNWTVTWAGDWSRLWLKVPSDILQGPSPLQGHTFYPESTTGVVQRITLGRGAPSWVRLEDLPPYFIDALLVAEDINFYRHHGIDTAGIGEALQANLRAGKTVRGGSTITQQLAKNLFLSRERTLARKFQEAVLAWQLEERLGKDTILEYYVNIIEWGPGIYGVERAARRYFDETASDLSLREAVFLCSIIPSPLRGYGYYRQGRVSRRWNRYIDSLLRKMHRFGYIDDAALQRGLAETISFRYPNAANAERPPFWAHETAHRSGPGAGWGKNPTGPQGPAFE